MGAETTAPAGGKPAGAQETRCGVESKSKTDGAQPKRKAKRAALSKKLRFEVFKRDSFACIYCGMKAPEVVLEIDHIHPVSKGGTNDLVNLATACSGCNAGKSNRTLDDKSALAAQRRQLAELQARREQIEMMVQWQRGLAALADHALDQVGEYFKQLVPGRQLNDVGRNELRQLLRAHPLDVVLEGLRTAATKHIRLDDAGDANDESVLIAWRAFSNGLRYREQRLRDPVGSELRYIRGIMRNRYAYCPPERVLALLTDAHNAGVSLERLRSLVFTNRNFTNFEADVLSETETALAESEGGT